MTGGRGAVHRIDSVGGTAIPNQKWRARRLEESVDLPVVLPEVRQRVEQSD